MVSGYGLILPQPPNKFLDRKDLSQNLLCRNNSFVNHLPGSLVCKILLQILVVPDYYHLKTSVMDFLAYQIFEFVLIVSFEICKTQLNSRTKTILFFSGSNLLLRISW